MKESEPILSNRNMSISYDDNALPLQESDILKGLGEGLG